MEPLQAIGFVAGDQSWTVFIVWYTPLGVTRWCDPWTVSDKEFKIKFLFLSPFCNPCSLLELEIPVFSPYCSGYTPFWEPANDFMSTTELWALLLFCSKPSSCPGCGQIDQDVTICAHSLSPSGFNLCLCFVLPWLLALCNQYSAHSF